MAVDSKRGDMWTADEDAKILSGVRRRAPASNHAWHHATRHLHLQARPHTPPARDTPCTSHIAHTHPRRTQVESFGLKWQVIANTLPGRSANAVRNRYLRCAPPGHHDHYLQARASRYSHIPPRHSRHLTPATTTTICSWPILSTTTAAGVAAAAAAGAVAAAARRRAVRC